MRFLIFPESTATKSVGNHLLEIRTSGGSEAGERCRRTESLQSRSEQMHLRIAEEISCTKQVQEEYSSKSLVL